MSVDILLILKCLKKISNSSLPLSIFKKKIKYTLFIKFSNCKERDTTYNKVFHLLHRVIKVALQELLKNFYLRIKPVFFSRILIMEQSTNFKDSNDSNDEFFIYD